MKPVIYKGVIYVPKIAEGKGILGDGMIRLDHLSEEDAKLWEREIEELKGKLKRSKE